MYREILYDVSANVATITLNRPDKLNAWTAQMDQEVRAAMSAAEGDPDVRVIVLTGAGRGFCAGDDMSLLAGIADAGLEPSGAHALAHGTSGEVKAGINPGFQRNY